MFKLTKEFKFEAAHKLPAHDGKCARLHGHSWTMLVTVAGDRLRDSGPKAGMLLDFGDLKAGVQPLVERCLDHHYLNETTGLVNPTSEELARWVYDNLKPAFPGLLSVEVRETCTSACTYHL